MPTVSMCFSLHLPVVMKPYSIFDIGSSESYWDWEKWEQDYHTLETCCILPCLDIWEAWASTQQVSFSLFIPGFMAEKMASVAPGTLKRIQRLVKKGTILMLSGTYSQSYAFLHDRTAFTEQIDLHEKAMQTYFGGCARIFYSPSWLYNNLLGFYLQHIGMKGILADGVEEILAGRNPNRLYHVMHTPDLKVFLRDRKLCMNVMYDMGNRQWDAYPLTVEKYVSWIHYLANIAENITLCFPLQTFGLTRKASEGIFDFLRRFPELVRQRHTFSFLSMEEVMNTLAGREAWDVPEFVTEHGNTDVLTSTSRQVEAMESLLHIGSTYGNTFPSALKQDWLLFQQVDHIQRMGSAYNPLDISGYPYEQLSSAYGMYMQAVADLELKAKAAAHEEEEALEEQPKQG